MEKRLIIDEILQINRSAKPEFLAEFGADELRRYLDHLRVALTPRICCDPDDPVSFDPLQVQPALGVSS